MVWQEAALPMTCYIVRKEPRRLPKNVVAAWGAAILRVHGVSNLHFY